MSFHDAHARTTPLDLAFPEDDALRDAVARIREEAQARGADTGDLGAFGMLASVNAIIRDVGGVGAPPDGILQHVALLFHLFHFTLGGGRVHLVSAPVARRLAAGPPGEGAGVSGGAGAGGGPIPLLPPAPAGYVQLPRHLFWVHPDPAGPAEAVDGFFWAGTAGASGGGPGGDGADTGGELLHLLLATGIHDARPGLTVVPLPAAPLSEAETWVAARCRPDGDDFANTLPGGELDALLAFTTAGEVFKLAGRLFAYMERTPGALEAGGEGEGGDAGVRHKAGAAPAPSRLPYVRVVLGPEEETGA